MTRPANDAGVVVHSQRFQPLLICQVGNLSHIFLLYLLLLVFANSCSSSLHDTIKKEYNLTRVDKPILNAYAAAHVVLQHCIRSQMPVKAHPRTKLDTVIVDPNRKKLTIKYTAHFGYVPLREDDVSEVYTALKTQLGKSFSDFTIGVYAGNYQIEQLVPNFYRQNRRDYDESRMPRKESRGAPIVKNISKPWRPERGLFNRNIALWPSHGWYYEPQRKRWEWQRARVFQTVEDLLPMAFVVPYLIPMLENAGATVFQPRERDLQTHEVIVDNDSSLFTSDYFETSSTDSGNWLPAKKPGFAIGKPPYSEGITPFNSGSYKFIKSDTMASSKITWIPEIPEAGYYAVYISYKSFPGSVDDAQYIVYHSGGKTEFRVNQKIGGGTWVYLGKFHFLKGKNPDFGKVSLTNQSKTTGGVITADAVRFGGGMGNVSREGKISGRPRYMEGARYYMQYAGMPNTLVYNVTENPFGDYKDDYQGRGEWVNYLKGAPFGPNKKRDTPGLRIPIDLSLAFHTDAGATQNDTTIGTLMIYSTTDSDSNIVFPDGTSRLANRDLGDIMQTQIADDLREKYDPNWNRRFLWDARYSEAFRLNVPAVLLELLSHHNFQDMKFALDPRFRFDASRAIYKSMLKFITAQNDEEFVVQPLPVTHLSAEFSGENSVTLRWNPQPDSLEPSAIPEKYIVYTRIEDGGFDNGTLVEQPEITLSNLQDSVIYSYKVTAVNGGGESFPSEVLSVCRINNEKPVVLIVNGFDRVSGPATLEADNLRGFADFWDQGVPDKYDLNYIGSQFDFIDGARWTNDESPGHGASHADFETKIIPGNTFDFPLLHGKSIRAAGFSFVAASDEAVEDNLVDLANYRIADFIMGEEKTTDWPKPGKKKQFAAFSPKLQQQLSRFCQSGGSLFLSGAHIGTDLFAGKMKKRKEDENHPDVTWAIETLKFYWRTNHAAKTGKVHTIESPLFLQGDSFLYNAGYHPEIYTVEAPDALIPAGENAFSIFRYSENNMSAGIAYKGEYKLVVLGFPFEAVFESDMRNLLMGKVLHFLRFP